MHPWHAQVYAAVAEMLCARRGASPAAKKQAFDIAQRLAANSELDLMDRDAALRAMAECDPAAAEMELLLLRRDASIAEKADQVRDWLIQQRKGGASHEKK